MSNRELTQVESVFHAVLERSRDDREAFLEQACQGDQALYAEVSSLISAYDSRGRFIEEPALDLGLQVLSQSSEFSLIGKSIGTYKVISRLGKGGMGEVYLAEDTKLERKVALKFLSPEFVGDNWAKRQLVREAQAVAMLDHPNICPVYGIEEIDGHTFIVMRYVDGETLADLINNDSFTMDQVIPLARQIAGALAEAHAHGIIHRDIKPRNILVMPMGQVKVLDFGLAKSVQTSRSLESLDDSLSNLSQVGIVPGTVAYMSPEQLRGEKLDYRSDLFSLGTVIYELIGGRNPFSKPSMVEVISRILTETPPPLTAIKSDCPKGLDPIVQKCLSKDRESRYQSANEILVDLDYLERNDHPKLRWSTPSMVRVAGLFAVLLISLFAVAFLYTRWTRTVHTVAVLPIVCEGIPPDACPSDAIRASIISRISNRTDLVVNNGDYSQQSMMSGQLSPQTIGQRLGVEAVLWGRIVKRGESTILQTRLESTSSSSRMAENEYSLPSQAVPLLEEISVRLAFYPDAPTSEEEKKSYATLAALQNRNAEAVELYLRGLYFWNKRDRENIPKAIEFFEKAIERDQVYALAYSGLANCYVVMSSVAYGTLTPKDAMERANAAARKALEIDPNLAEAQTSLGVVQMRYYWNWPDAEKSFKRAIELKPDYPLAHYWYSSLLGTTGRQAEAVAESEKAKSLDPLTPLFITNLGRAYYRARDYDKAIDYFERILDEKPDNTSASYVLAYAYFQKARYADAIRLLEKISVTNKWLGAGPLGYAYAKTGRTDEARKILAEMEAAPKEENLPAQERAIVYLGLGDNDSAFSWLEKSYEDHFPSILALTTDPIFDSLRSDPRFVTLARKVNLTP
jgi:serine/threonine-protein kinase